MYGVRKRFLVYRFYIAICIVLAARYSFCAAAGEYRVPEEWTARFGEELSVEGIVTGKEERESVCILYLSNHLIVYDMNFTEVMIGSRIRVAGELEDFSEQRNPGGFDEKKYYRRKKYWAKIFSKQITVLESGGRYRGEMLYRLRKHWTEFLKRELGEENGGILAAILLGNKGSADTEVKEWYQKAGVGHLLAVSGFHVGFFGAVLYTLFRKIRIPVSVSSGMTGVLLFLYVLLCQASASAVRAYIMYMILLGAGVCGRAYHGIHALIISGAVLLFIQPMYITDAGFLLSFGAMAGILIVYPVILEYFPGAGKVVQNLLVSLSVQSVILPILLYFFYEIPVYAFVMGLLVTGIFGILMSSAGLGCVLEIAAVSLSGNMPGITAGGQGIGAPGSVLEMGAHVILYPAGWILRLYQIICRLELRFPFARWTPGRPGIWKMILYYMLLVSAVLFLKKRKERKIKRKCFIGCISGGILMLLLFCRLPDFGMVTLTMLDVGQGDCFFIQGPEGGTYLVDGGSSDENQPGKYIVEPFLKARGISRVDYVFLSHGDEDHVNGIVEMMQRQTLGIKIENLVCPRESVWDEGLKEAAREAEQSGIRVLAMEEGDSLSEGELRICALYPGKEDEPEPGNEASLVLDVRYRDFSALMTGDLGKDGEDMLLRRIGENTVLKLGHHGSKNSSSEAFLARVQPEYVLISAGNGNRYGHPHEETLERVKECGAGIYRTDEMGAVTIRTDGKYMQRPEQTLRR